MLAEEKAREAVRSGWSGAVNYVGGAEVFALYNVGKWEVAALNSQCFRGWTKLGAFGAASIVAIYTGGSAAGLAYGLTESIWIAAGAAGVTVAPQSFTIQRLGSGAYEDIKYGC